MRLTVFLLCRPSNTTLVCTEPPCPPMIDFAAELLHTIWVARDSSKRRVQGFVLCVLVANQHETWRLTSGGKEVDMMIGADQSKLSRFVQTCAGASGGGGEDIQRAINASRREAGAWLRPREERPADSIRLAAPSVQRFISHCAAHACLLEQVPRRPPPKLRPSCKLPLKHLSK